ncbi:hypothetical protein NL676_008961 [Syzygium grande]|nr:hypothetical protein NL676_008961 [Syzygium grande]
MGDWLYAIGNKDHGQMQLCQTGHNSSVWQQEQQQPDNRDRHVEQEQSARPGQRVAMVCSRNCTKKISNEQRPAASDRKRDTANRSRDVAD